MAKTAYTAHIFSGTHWDREWYYPEEVFRTRLVELLDGVLRLLEDPSSGYQHFTLDGQAIVAEDYLEIRPEDRQRIERLVRAGTLHVGPAYVLPDLCIPNGESIIRNLLVGRRIARALGRCMRSCYMPDMFGHPSQMPQIARGFGLDSYIFWRGASSPKDTPQTEVEWEAPDGTRIFAIHFNDIYGYGSASRLPVEPEALRAKMEPVLREAKQWAAGRALILPNCLDHDYAQPDMARVIEVLDELFPDIEFRHSTLDDYVADARRRLRGKPPVIRGEQRRVCSKPAPNGGELLWGTITSRMPIKQMDRGCDQALLRWAEPFQALAWSLGAGHQTELLDRAWKWLLRNHPHDTICGCSTDPVHRTAEDRYRHCLDLADTLAGYAMDAVLDRHLVGKAPADERAFAVFNPLPYPVSGECSADVDVPIEGKRPALRVVGLDGRPVPHVVHDVEKTLHVRNRLEEPIEWRWPRRARCSLWCDELPPLGYRLFKLVAEQPSAAPPELTSAPDGVLENDHLRAVIRSDGAVDLTHKASGRTFAGLHVLVDKGDAGDEYSYSWPERDDVIRSTDFPCTVRKLEQSPVRAAYEIATVMRLPASATANFKGRSRMRVPNPVRTVVSLGRNARRLEFATTVENNSKDHTLRAAFPTRLRTESSFAEMPFDVTERPIAVERPPEEAWIEEPPGTHPQGTFCYLSDGDVSLAVLNKGLPGYDVPDEPTRTIELTLFRAVGCIARGELLTRRMFLLPVPTPDAQCLGTNTYEYAVTVVEGNDPGAIALEAHAFNAGLRSIECDKGFPIEPADVSFIKLSPPSLVGTAVKRAESGRHLVVRCYNATARTIAGRLELFAPVKKAWYLAPSEDRLSEIADVKGRVVKFKAGAKQIVTLGLALGRRKAAGGDAP